MKVCTKCHQTKPLTGFYKDSSLCSGHQSDCKMCRSAHAKKWREKRRRRRPKIQGKKWQVRKAPWESYFQALKMWKEKHGFDRTPPRFCTVPQDKGKRPLELGFWTYRQRLAFRNTKKSVSLRTQCYGTLSAEEIEKLESVAFQWDPLSIAWEHHFVALVIWKEKNGYNKDPPIDYKTFIPCDKEDKHISLGGWCFYQRWRKKHKWDKRKQEEGHYGREAAEIIRRLESVGFLWGETRKLLHPRKKADETTMHKNKKKLIL